MKVAIIYTSMFGNTKMFAELICEKLSEEHEVELINLDTDGFPNVEKYKSLILGTYTWVDGSLPEIHKDFAYELQHKPKNVFVFGTGETQFGENHFCNGAKKLHKYYNSELEVGMVEQKPTDSQEVIALQWIKKLQKKLGEI